MTEMRKLKFIICLALLSFSAHATLQAPDLLHIEEEVWMLDELPFDYLDEALSKELQDAIYEMNDVISSACWRGYVAEWSVHDGNLYLEKVSDPDGKEYDYEVFSRILSKYSDNGKIAARWIEDARILVNKDLSWGTDVRSLRFSDGAVTIGRTFSAKDMETVNPLSLYEEFLSDLFPYQRLHPQCDVLKVIFKRVKYSGFGGHIFVSIEVECDNLSEEEHKFYVDEIQKILRDAPWSAHEFMDPVYPIKEGDSFEIRINI